MLLPTQCHAFTSLSSAWPFISTYVHWRHNQKWTACCYLMTCLLTAGIFFVADCLDPQLAKQLEDEIFLYRSQTFSTNTKTTYRTHRSSYFRFCRHMGYPLFQHNPPIFVSTVEPRLSGHRLSGLFDYPDFFSGPVFFMNINDLRC